MGDKDYAVVSFDVNEIRNMKAVALCGRPYADRVSLTFAARLAVVEKRKLGYHEIISELDFLEGLRPTSRTKQAEPFKGAILSPLWHKHFYTARHFTKNIGIRWSLDRSGNKDFGKLITDALTKGNLKTTSHELVIGGFQDRARKGLTGDWIIFGKHCEKNYYIDLATHDEGKNETALMEKIRLGSQAEFPFLFGSVGTQK